MLSLALAFALFLGAWPVRAFAAETDGEDVSQVVDSGAAMAQKALRKAARAGEMGKSVTIEGNALSANGIPIVIKQNGSITSVYGEDGTLLSGENDISNWVVYGGWSDGGTHYGDPSITVESGTVGAICGGNNGGVLEGNPTVTVKSGTINYICGGGVNGTTTGNTYVTIEDGTITHVYGGGEGDTQTGNSTVTVYGGTIEWLRGSSNIGTQTGNASITIMGGNITNAVYANGYYAALNGDTSIVMEGGAATFLFGGGYSGGADNSRIEIYGGQPGTVYGGGEDYASIRETATIVIGENYDPQGRQVHLFGSGNGENATVGSAHFDVSMASQRAVQLSGQSVTRTETGGIAFSKRVTGKVTANIHDRNPAGGESVNMYEVDEVTAENCKVSLMSGLDGYPEIPEQLNLERLEIAATGEVIFGIGNKAVNIGELAGSGTITFEGTSSKMPTAIQVSTISATAQDPFKLKTSGGMPESLWIGKPWFQGSGVQALDSPDCFVFSVDGFLPQKATDGNSIQLVRGDTRKQAVLVDPYFDKDGYGYGDTMTVTMKLLVATNNQPIPGATVEVRVGPASDKTIASAVTGADGGVTFTLPVDDQLWQERERGMQAIFWGNDQYKQNFYGISLNGGAGDMSFDVSKASITLEGTVAAPVLNTAPATDFPSSPDAFYTAQLVWSPADPTFQLDRAYSASIRLLPKPGFSLDSEKIESITWNGKTLEVPAPEADGSLLLRDAATFDPIPGRYVAVTSSPAEGGTATGGGRYPAGTQVTVKATPAENWQFKGWEENGSIVSTLAEYTFAANANRTLTARFEKIQYTITLTASPAKGGTVTGGGIYAPGAAVTVTVALNPGWQFKGWQENGAIVSTDLTYTFTPNASRSLTALFERAELTDEDTEVQSDPLTVAPGHLQNHPRFNTPEAITAELRRVVETHISEVGDNLAVYDVKLVYRETREPVEWENFPAAGINAVLPYPDGTNGDDYTFTIQHMISYGRDAGKVEDMSYTALPNGLGCHFNSLSPVAIGWQKKDAVKPAPSGGSSGSDEKSNDEYDFWQEVRRKIEKAAPGDTVKVNARGYDKLPWSVMDALKNSVGVTLAIQWSGGGEIVIPSAGALEEALRIYYPLAYLAGYDFGVPSAPLNPETGGVWTVEAPASAEPAVTPSGAPEVTDPRRGLADTPEQAARGVERAIPAAAPNEPAPREDGGNAIGAALLLLAASACGGVWAWKKRRGPDSPA